MFSCLFIIINFSSISKWTSSISSSPSIHMYLSLIESACRFHLHFYLMLLIALLISFTVHISSNQFAVFYISILPSLFLLFRNFSSSVSSLTSGVKSSPLKKLILWVSFWFSFYNSSCFHYLIGSWIFPRRT